MKSKCFFLHSHSACQLHFLTPFHLFYLQKMHQMLCICEMNVFTIHAHAMYNVLGEKRVHVKNYVQKFGI